MSQSDKPVSLFISYSHRDDELRKKLDTHLSGLKRPGLVSVWHDRRIGAGQEWANEIDDNLNSAEVILLLISPEFMASDYCFDLEMKRAMERHDAGDAIVVPVILRPCEWEAATFHKCQALPKDARPITSWQNLDEAMLDVVKGIREALSRVRRKVSVSETSLEDLSRPLRPLLPYLCDRGPHEEALIDGLERHQKAAGTRPVVLLIHGDELESHSDFIARIQSRTLPKLLGLDAKRQKVRTPANSMRPPARADDPPAYWRSMGDALFENRGATREEIQRYLAQHQEPLIIVLELSTEDFLIYGPALLDAVVEFCANWSDLPAGRWIALAVNLKYRRIDSAGIFDFRKKKLRQLNEDMRVKIRGAPSID